MAQGACFRVSVCLRVPASVPVLAGRGLPAALARAAPVGSENAVAGRRVTATCWRIFKTETNRQEAAASGAATGAAPLPWAPPRVCGRPGGRGGGGGQARVTVGIPRPFERPFPQGRGHPPGSPGECPASRCPSRGCKERGGPAARSWTGVGNPPPPGLAPASLAGPAGTSHLVRHRSKASARPRQARGPGREPRSPLLGCLDAHRQRGHGSDRLGFLVLALLGLDQGVAHGGGETLQGAPVLAWGGGGGSVRTLGAGLTSSLPRPGGLQQDLPGALKSTSLSGRGSQGVAWLQSHKGWDSLDRPTRDEASGMGPGSQAWPLPRGGAAGSRLLPDPTRSL